MGFVGAIKSFYKRYFDFKGRSSRSEYWWVFLFSMIIGILVMLPLMGPYVASINEMAAGGQPDFSWMFSAAALPYALFVLINLIPNIALIVRRIHDHDKSGWWFPLMYVLMLIPLINIVAIIIALVFFCRRGTVGPNRFGMDPLGGGASAFD